MLERIRSALADGPPAVPIPRDYDAALAPPTDIPALFVERCGDYRATVQRTTDVELPAVVATILARHGVERLAVPEGVPERWLARHDRRPSR